MPRPKIYDSPHQRVMINNWIKYGLILREGETYKGIYSFYMNTDFCQLCSVKLNDEKYNHKKTMDHCHSTGYFRQILCHTCNSTIDSKIPHLWISLWKRKQKGRTYISFAYERKGFKKKISVSLTKLIAYSFIQLLKKPI